MTFLETLHDYKSRGLLMNQVHPTLPLTIWNYTPETAYGGHWDEITLSCRGLVTDDAGNIVGKGFEKFFNLEEQKHAPTDDFEVFEKLDGCCYADTLIETEHGTKTIKEVCETKYSGKIHSYNTDLGQTELKPITNHSIGDESFDWYELELEDGTTLKVTGNHKIWIDNLNCYRRVDELFADFENLYCLKN